MQAMNTRERKIALVMIALILSPFGIIWFAGLLEVRGTGVIMDGSDWSASGDKFYSSLFSGCYDSCIWDEGITQVSGGNVITDFYNSTVNYKWLQWDFTNITGDVIREYELNKIEITIDFNGNPSVVSNDFQSSKQYRPQMIRSDFPNYDSRFNFYDGKFGFDNAEGQLRVEFKITMLEVLTWPEGEYLIFRVFVNSGSFQNYDLPITMNYKMYGSKSIAGIVSKSNILGVTFMLVSFASMLVSAVATDRVSFKEIEQLFRRNK